MNMYSISN